MKRYAAAVADVSVDPAEPASRRLDGRDPAVERLGAPRPQRDVPEPGSGRLGELQAVAEVVAPAAQEDGLPVARFLLHAEHVDEEAEALLRLRGEELRVPDPGEVVDRLAHGSDEVSQTVEVVRELARLELRALLALALLAREGGRQHLVDPLALDDDRAVRVEHDDVALADARAADLDGLADRAGNALLRSAHANVPRPDRQPDLPELLDVAHRGVHQQRGDARDLRLRREQLADERDRPGLGHREDEHLARLGLGHRRVDHQVVVLAAAHGSRRAGRARARHDLDQRHVDHRGAPGGLVHGRGAQPGELAERVGHSALTTCGVTRWNASAYRIAALPEERRAWLPRCSARCE